MSRGEVEETEGSQNGFFLPDGGREMLDTCMYIGVRYVHVQLVLSYVPCDIDCSILKTAVSIMAQAEAAAGAF